jgi:uncharacterized protein YbcI
MPSYETQYTPRELVERTVCSTVTQGAVGAFERAASLTPPVAAVSPGVRPRRGAREAKTPVMVNAAGAMVDRSLVGSSPFASRADPNRRTREKAAMSAPEAALTGEELLVAVTEAMVAFHHRYHHRNPVTAKTLLLGDELLACVLGGIYTDVEKTMIELQRAPLVHETRSAFQNAMEHRFIAAIERLSGREVLTFMSNHHVGPDIEIELFMLAPRPVPAPTVA